MSKYVVRLIDSYDRRQVKQKTFKAESWDHAEVIAHDVWYGYEVETGRIVDMSLSIVK